MFVRENESQASYASRKKGGLQYGPSVHPLCDYHRLAVPKYLGENARFGGTRAAWWTVDSESGHRSLNQRFTHMIIFEKSGGKCAHCSCDLVWNSSPKKYERKTWISDHIVPIFMGGKTTLSNLQALCLACDRVKSGKDKSEASKARWRGKRHQGRGLTHYEKDLLIESLRAENARLKSNSKGININGTRAGFFRGHSEGDRGRDTLTSFRDFNE
jgi:hypothetical protein